MTPPRREPAGERAAGARSTADPATHRREPDLEPAQQIGNAALACYVSGAPNASVSTPDLAALLGAAMRGDTAPLDQALPSAAVGDQAAQCVPMTFDRDRPWIVSTAKGASRVALSQQLYGADYAEIMEVLPNAEPGSGTKSNEDRYIVIPEALLPELQTTFREQMQARLKQGVDVVEGNLLETRIDAQDEGEMMAEVRYWAETKDLRLPSGRTYFDEFLTRLRDDWLYTDYGVTESGRRSFLDELFKEVEEAAGALLALIARNSVEFGAYRPDWMAYGPTGEADGGLEAGVNPDLVKRTATMVLDGLEGYTNRDESNIIATALTALPAREQAEVFQEIMSHYDDRTWIGLGKYGEPTEESMLYYLFEDLMPADRMRLANSVRETGVLPEQAITALVEGRPLAGRLMPWTTHKGEQAAMYWADVYNESSGPKAAGAAVLGSFASLWTPNTAGATVLTLTTAGLASPAPTALGAPTTMAFLAEKFPVAMRVAAVGGTGVGAFETTIAFQKAVMGKDPWSGQQLDYGQRVASVLGAISGTLFLASGFMPTPTPHGTSSSGASLVRSGGGVPSGKLPPGSVFAGEGGGMLAEGTTGLTAGRAAGSGGQGASHVNWRVLGADPDTGIVTAIGEHAGSGAKAVARLDPRTGNGTVVDVMTGEMIPIYGGRLGRAPRGLLPGDVPGAALVPAEPHLPAAPPPSGAGELVPGQWYELPAPTRAPVPPTAAPQGPLMLGTGEFAPGTLGARLSRDSLDLLAAEYGPAVRDAVAAARTRADVEAIANTLRPGIDNQFKGTLGERLLIDEAPLRGMHAPDTRGPSYEQGLDVPMVSLRGPPEIVIGEAKLGASRTPYRIGAGDLPVAYHDPAEMFERLYAVVRNPNVPRIVRVRMKAALDEGRIRWQLNQYGNVRVRIRGNDRFPGDVEVVMPFNL